MSAEHKEVARRFFEDVLGQGRFELLEELAADDIVARPAPEVELHGRDEVRAFMQAMRDGFSDLAVTVVDQVAEGNRVATGWVAHGTHDGDYMGFEPTGRDATIKGIVIQTFRDGMIAEGWTGMDRLSLLQQLGVVPEPARA